MVEPSSFAVMRIKVGSNDGAMQWKLNLLVQQKAVGGQATDETRDLEKTPEGSARTGQAGRNT
jgi:hypothetical protein